MPDRGKGRFNWIACADALPMLGRKVEECHELLAIFLQAQRRLGIFGLVDFNEQIERLFCIIFSLSLPYVVERLFSPWLRELWKAIQNIHGFVLPAALMARFGIYFVQCRPEAHGTVHCPAGDCNAIC